MTSSSLTPVWKDSPGQPNYYINSAAICADASRMVAGTFYHQYASSSRRDPRLAARSGSDPQTGTFGVYCYRPDGTKLWKDEFVAWQGVYWVDLSSDGACAAAGGWFSSTPTYAGFVRAYDAAKGALLLNHATEQRVNQVALSADGTWLVSAAESLVLFQRGSSGYTVAGTYALAEGDQIVSTAISADGATIVATTYLGKILLLAGSASGPALVQSWPLPSGYSHCIRLTPSGASFVAGGSGGNVYVFDTAGFTTSGQPTLTRSIATGGSIYGVAISDDGATVVGLVNQGEAGLVDCFSRSGSTATPRWTAPTARNPNCASLNTSAGLVAVADGHPDETPGNFYLFDATSGASLGQYGTTNMSWPIMLSADGSAVIGGSDDSFVYCFKTN